MDPLRASADAAGMVRPKPSALTVGEGAVVVTPSPPNGLGIAVHARAEDREVVTGIVRVAGPAADDGRQALDEASSDA